MSPPSKDSGPHRTTNAWPQITGFQPSNTRILPIRPNKFERASFVGFTVTGANTSWYGAGLRIIALEGSLYLAGNIVHGNATSSTSSGGGGIYQKTANGSRVINNLIYDNQAVRGGGILFAGGDVDFWHNTITGNTATGGLGGGASTLLGVVPDVRNNILWSNSGSGATAELHQLPAALNNIVTGAASGSGNFDADPLFVDAINRDFHLLAASPAIDTATELPVAVDIDAQRRFVSGFSDLGADEFPEPDPGSDEDMDGLTYEEEVALGTNPLFGNNILESTGIISLVVLNPNAY